MNKNRIKARLVEEMLKILSEQRDTIVRRACVPPNCVVYRQNDKEFLERQEFGYAAFDNLFDHVQEKGEAYYPKEENHAAG